MDVMQKQEFANQLRANTQKRSQSTKKGRSSEGSGTHSDHTYTTCTITDRRSPSEEEQAYPEVSSFETGGLQYETIQKTRNVEESPVNHQIQTIAPRMTESLEIDNSMRDERTEGQTNQESMEVDRYLQMGNELVDNTAFTHGPVRLSSEAIGNISIEMKAGVSRFLISTIELKEDSSGNLSCGDAQVVEEFTSSTPYNQERASMEVSAGRLFSYEGRAEGVHAGAVSREEFEESQRRVKELVKIVELLSLKLKTIEEGVMSRFPSHSNSCKQ